MNAAARRRVSLGAALYIIGAVQFLIGMTVAALHYGPPPYNLQQNSISDLQAVNCGLFQGDQVCSPLHTVANSSVAILGLLLIAGTMLIRTGFPAGRRWSVALGLLVLAGAGALANAFAPEDVSITADTLTALVAFLGANFGLIQIGRLMSKDSGFRGFLIYTEVSGVVGVAALILYGASVTGPLGPGGMEWLIVAPILLWAFVMGIHFLRFP
jgi:hypothetical membrane protein